MASAASSWYPHPFIFRSGYPLFQFASHSVQPRSRYRLRFNFSSSLLQVQQPQPLNYLFGTGALLRGNYSGIDTIGQLLPMRKQVIAGGYEARDRGYRGKPQYYESCAEEVFWKNQLAKKHQRHSEESLVWLFDCASSYSKTCLWQYRFKHRASLAGALPASAGRILMNSRLNNRS